MANTNNNKIDLKRDVPKKKGVMEKMFGKYKNQLGELEEEQDTILNSYIKGLEQKRIQKIKNNLNS